MPCPKRMTLAVDGKPGAGCKASCLHRALVNDYQLARHNEEQAAETASIGYATEYAEYVAEHPLVTFKDWLIGHKKPAAEHEAAA